MNKPHVSVVRYQLQVDNVLLQGGIAECGGRKPCSSFDQLGVIVHVAINI